jgi:signal transduction histidine kinase
MNDVTPPDTSEPREHTDQSLRTERSALDRMVEQLAAVDATADAAITRARVKADAVLQAARERADTVLSTSGTGSATRILLHARSLEDRALSDERAEADHALRSARIETAVRLAVERRETDTDLSTERAESDDVLATRDEVLQIVSHDLRNMLGAICGMAELLEADTVRPTSAGTISEAQWILRAAHRMNRLIGDLTDVSNIEAGTLALIYETADPASIIGEVAGAFQALAAERRITLVSDIGSPLPAARFDPARIYQVLANLLSNAIKFTPQGETVVLSVRAHGDAVRFAVSDSGAGIAASSLKAVFARNVQLAKNDRRGSGLGLYISKAIVEGHRGKIWAESVVGAGSTFLFTIPG